MTIGNYLPLTCLLGIIAIARFAAGAVARGAIVGGRVAEKHQFPYQVYLQIHGSGQCGGGIIGNEHILSAAHCVFNEDGTVRKNPITVHAGTKDLSVPGVAVKVARIYVPLEYNARNIHTNGDIAVLQLTRPLELSKNKHLRVLKMPRYPQNENYTNDKAEIAGFGWDWIHKENNRRIGGFSDFQLRYSSVDVYNAKKCKFFMPRLSDKKLCARLHQDEERAEPRGTCSGDSGGPLVYGGTTVIGILSTGPLGCSEEFTVSVYTRVMDYVDFIQDVLHDMYHTKNMYIYDLPQ